MTLRLVRQNYANAPAKSIDADTHAPQPWQRPRPLESSHHSVTTRSETVVGVLASALLVTALLLGGGTRNFLFSDLLVQLLAAVLLIYGLRRLRWQDLDQGARQYLQLVALVIALPLLQLLPLPSALVSWFPGRSELWAGRAALGLEVPTWVPWSLDPNATLAGVRGLLPASAMALLATQLGPVWQKRLAVIVVAVAVLMVPIGIAQVAQGPHSTLRPYVPTNLHDAVGLFANRNHYASLLATALVFIFGGLLLNARGGRSRSARVLQMIGWMLLGAILLLGIVLSRSRAGVGLAGLVSIAMLLVAFTRRREHPETFRWFLGFVVFGGLIAFQFGFLAIADRFAQAGDQRWDVTAGVLAVSSNYSWLGTGIGSFPAVYAAHEPIELVGDKILNHAHNDWAELWVELGVALLAVAALFAWWLSSRARELIASGSLAQSSQALRLTGIGVLLTLSVHSLVDYPLRTTAVSVVFALGGALACCRLEPASSRPRRDSRRAVVGA